MFNQQGSIRVVKLLMHETGTYNQQWRRPYHTNLDGNGLAALQERLGGSTSYQPSQLAGVANQFIMPSAIPEKQILIPNGWDTNRMRFMLEIEHSFRTGGKLTEIILGYTSFNGANVSGAIARDMEFYVNSVLQLRQTQEFVPGMGNSTHVTMADCSHILANNDWNGLLDANQEKTVRPEDVFANMTTNYLQDAGTVVDGRTTLSNTAIKSRRSNAIAPTYMANVLESHKVSLSLADTGQGMNQILHSARGNAAEQTAGSDPFLVGINSVRGSHLSNVFTYGDLCNLDPNTDRLCTVTLLGNTNRNEVHSAGQTAYWHEADNVTQAATILSQSVPGIMMELMLTKLYFKSTNRTIGSQIFTNILDSNGFANIDLTPYLQRFMQRLEIEILRDLTFSNQIDYALEMGVDLLGETWIKLSLNGGPMIDYVTPSFCDALLVPVVSNNFESVRSMTEDFDALITTINASGDCSGNFQNFNII